MLSNLQVAQNNAARLVLKKRKRDHASPLLRKLHWLPIDKRIQYKMATLCFRCLNGSAPTYLSDLLELYVPSRQLRSSSDKTKLKVYTPKFKTFGERSFVYLAPKVWNSLPRNLRESQNVSVFKKNLKTHLFSL